MKRPLRVLFLIEDGSYLYDNRVRREAKTLQQAGVTVSVICPREPGERWHDVVDNVSVYRYSKPSVGGGILAHILEYAVSLMSHGVLSLYVAITRGFDVIHAANPPDLLCLVAAPYKLFGKKFVFDHHDLVPELFADRFGQRTIPILKVVYFMERVSFALADRIVSTNESYRRIALSRGNKDPDSVVVVRNGPDPDDFSDARADAKTRSLASHVVGYLGNMNEQDGVDHLLQAARLLCVEQNREDLAFILVGQGDEFDRLLELRDELGLQKFVRMPGRLPWGDVINTLSACDICVQPDPPRGLNDISTMNKLMEYMMLGKAVVSYDLKETRVSGSDTIAYAAGNDYEDLAAAIALLLDDASLRDRLGRAAHNRILETLAWPHQESLLLSIYDSLYPGRIPSAGRV